jgi:hypothetical protein
MRVTWLRAVFVALAIAISATGVALATPGFQSVTEVQARGTMVDPFGEKMKVILGLVTGYAARPM